MGEVIAVLSGKGGTGKTSITAGLATALAKEGKRVLCAGCHGGGEARRQVQICRTRECGEGLVCRGTHHIRAEIHHADHTDYAYAAMRATIGDRSALGL